MKLPYILLGLMLITPLTGAFTYMGNNTLTVTNATGQSVVLTHNQSMNMSNTTYHLRLDAPDQSIDVAMVNTVATKFVYEIIFGLLIAVVVFGSIYRLTVGHLG